ncbi:DUF6047 family protein [uncultured Alistipes sp.]|uniref:DUF6047 family protein n=1 Tax=uncultured Alistipes sp. TaxID=538949 RepID=UPI00260B5EB4|nr:DUF6047 family protein [uncultured Alistipes sp.]
MNNAENSSRIQPEESLHPGDVFMMLAPDGKVQVASANGRFFKNFEHFTRHCATALLNQMRPPYGNSFFVHWRFENPASVWADYENISVYPRRLLQAVRDQGLRPRATRRLYPLLYGIQKGCDTRQMADLYDNPDYLDRVCLYEGSNAEERPLSYRGIETDAGVLLFNSTARGESLYGEYLHFLAAHFYDPRMDLTFVRTLELLPEETLRSKINPPVDKLREGRTEAFCRLPSVYYAEQDQLGIYTELRRFDLTPKETNFVCLSSCIKSLFPESSRTLIEGKIQVELSAGKSSQELQINSNIVHNNNQMRGNGIGRHLPDVAERLSQRSVKKKGIVR